MIGKSLREMISQFGMTGPRRLTPTIPMPDFPAFNGIYAPQGHTMSAHQERADMNRRIHQQKWHRHWNET